MEQIACIWIYKIWYDASNHLAYKIIPVFSLNSSGNTSNRLLVTPKKLADNAIAVEDAAERKTLRGEVPIIDISCVGVGAVADCGIDCIFGCFRSGAAAAVSISSLFSSSMLAERSAHDVLATWCLLRSCADVLQFWLRRRVNSMWRADVDGRTKAIDSPSAGQESRRTAELIKEMKMKFNMLLLIRKCCEAMYCILVGCRLRSEVVG